MGFCKSRKAQKPSSAEIFASAQVVVNAAKNKFHNPDSSSAEDISYGKLAGAAGTLIGAASQYGKLKKTSVGKYAQKAQEYLHSYESKNSKPGMTVSPPQPSDHHTSSGYGGQGHPPSTHTSSEVNHSQPSEFPLGYPAGYPPPDTQQNYGYGTQGHSKPAELHVNVDTYHTNPPSRHTSSEVNHSQPSAQLPGYPAGYPPQGYPDILQNYGYGPDSRPAESHANVYNYHINPPSTHTSSEVNHGLPSAPPLGYAAGYPPQGYPQHYGYGPQGPSGPAESHVNVDSYPCAGHPPQGYPQNYGYGPQCQSRPAESHVNVDSYPPVGYPPAGYPTSSGNYNRPSKYS